VDVWQSVNDIDTGWLRVGDDEFDFDFLAYKGDERVYAVFHVAGSTPPEIALSVSTLTPVVTTGSDGQDKVGVGNSGGQTLSWTAAVDQTWLSLDPDNGSVTGGVNSMAVNYATAGLAEGNYTATITVSAAGVSNSPQLIDVTLTVAPPTVVIYELGPQGKNATAILNLVVDNDLYDVAFELAAAQDIYGPEPPAFDFPGEEEAGAAVDAVADALNDEDEVETLGPQFQEFYGVGFNFSDGVVDKFNAEKVILVGWEKDNDPKSIGYGVDATWAVFELLGGSPPPAPPTIDFSADPETIEAGEFSTLSWDVLDATTCTGSLGSNGWPGDKDPLFNSEDVSPTATSTYLLTCDGPGGQSESEVTVAVLDPALGITSARQTKKVNTISGLDFGVAGTYMKPGFPLDLPQSSITGNTLFHDGGSFTFSSPQTTTTYPYSNWTFEIRSTCAANGDACLVETDEGTPWALRDVGLTAGTARMVFTEEGADAFNDLAGAATTVEVFVTSQSFTGDLKSSAGEFTGLDGADTICTNAAKDAGHEGAWTAWISDGNTDVVDRMFDAEFQLLDGTIVANSLADLTDGTLQVPINLDENLDTVLAGSNSQVWTATESDGRYGDSGTCNSWTSSDGETFFGQIGDASSVFAGWTDVGAGNPCDSVNRLYCFSASKFLPEETFADVTFIPEPSAGALATAAVTTLALLRSRRASRRRRR
jgi:hypothetical protein